MRTKKIVIPKEIAGHYLSLWQLFGACGPKLTIVCGECNIVFRERIPVSIRYPVIACPHCGTGNKIPTVPADD